jgi:glycosyltransferase involved in cell wall biosynthesis
MKIALVHDFLTQRGGAERVFELLCRRYPDADIYTSVYDPERTIALEDRVVNTTWLQAIPGAKQYFRMMAPLYFPAFRSLDLQSYDLILSSTTSFAKAVRKRPGARHICFCHNVTRFLWDTTTYLKEYGDYSWSKALIRQVFQAMKSWDLKYAQEPDMYIANSTTVAKRIEEIYSRPATVVNYPIDDRRFTFSDQKDDFYLVSARFLGYKRIDLIVEAFNALGLPLVITGDGPENDRLRAMAKENITFLGHVSDAERTHLMSRAKAVIVAALEDYGLVPVEANASGTPVIAYGAGGVLDTQIPGKTGLFFAKQTSESLIAALLDFQTMTWNHHEIRDWAIEQFSERAFFAKVDRLMAGYLERWEPLEPIASKSWLSRGLA